MHTVGQLGERIRVTFDTRGVEFILWRLVLDEAQGNTFQHPITSLLSCSNVWTSVK